MGNFDELLQDYCALVPLPERRPHLVLLSRRGTGRPAVRAVVPPGQEGALALLRSRFTGNGLEVVIAKAEDGLLDPDVLRTLAGGR